MAKDDKDLGVRPVQEALLALADKMDEEKLAILKAHEPELSAAHHLIQQGEHATAAVLFDLVSASFAKAHLPLEAKYWADRAAACRKVRPPKPDGRRGRRAK